MKKQINKLKEIDAKRMESVEAGYEVFIVAEKVDELVRGFNSLLEDREGEKENHFALGDYHNNTFMPRKLEVRSEEAIKKGAFGIDTPSETPEWWEESFNRLTVEDSIEKRDMGVKVVHKMIYKNQAKDFISSLLVRERGRMFKEIFSQWMSLNLTYDNEKNWNDELTKFSLFMQGLKARLRKDN